jgi:hypothetical protein
MQQGYGKEGSLPSGHTSKLFDDSVAVSVAPTQTTFITFTILPYNSYGGFRPSQVWLTLENTDVAQTMDVWIQTRIKAGSGSWVTMDTFNTFMQMAPLVARTGFFECFGMEEVRVVGTASGAGLDAVISRRMAWPG